MTLAIVAGQKRFITVVLLLLTVSGWGDHCLQARLSGVTQDGRLVVVTEDSYAGQTVVALAGSTIPPRAQEPFTHYCGRLLTGRTLTITIIDIHDETDAFRSYTGLVDFSTQKAHISLNKQLLVDGYGLVSNAFRDAWGHYQEKAQTRQVGLWSLDDHWVVPRLSPL